MQLDYQTTSGGKIEVSKPALWTGRVLTSLISLFLLADGAMKVIKLKPVMDACVKYGFTAHQIQGIGILLIICTIIYLIPATSILGTILLTGYFGGAILLHQRFGDPIFSTVFVSIFGILSWLAIFLREPRLHVLIPLR